MGKLSLPSGPVRPAGNKWKESLPPAIGSLVLLVAVLGYIVLWGPIVWGKQVWPQAGDLWESLAAAHQVAWGSYGTVYSGPQMLEMFPGLVSFPAFYVVLAPVAWMVSHLRLSESIPIGLARPTAYPLVMGWSVLWSSSVIFAADSLARRLCLSMAKRVAVMAWAAVFVFDVTVLWGHPEDVVAVAFCLVALGALDDGRLAKSAWTMGLAVAFQPMALLAFAIVGGVWWRRRRWGALGLVARSGLLPSFLVAIPLVQDFRSTYRSIFVQPTFPQVGWRTPWMGILHQYVSSAHSPIAMSFACNHVSQLACRAFGNDVTGQLLIHPHQVNAGSVRLGALAASALLGTYVALRSKDPWLVELIWLTGVAFGIRCLFEAVMFPYYVAPACLLLAIAAVSMESRIRVASTWVASAGLVEYAWRHGPPWRWFTLLGALLAASTILSRPTGRGSDSAMVEVSTGAQSRVGEESASATV